MRLSKIFRWGKQLIDQKGQAFVETAFIFPLLLFIVLGLVEVGWALRGYLTLANINREVTRRAVKPFYLDFSNREVENGSYDHEGSVANTGYYDEVFFKYFGQNEEDFTMLPGLMTALNENSEKDEIADLTLTYFVVRTGYPCDPANFNGEDWDCDCTALDDKLTEVRADYSQAKAIYDSLADNFTYDDIILHPGMDGYQYYAYQYVRPGEAQPGLEGIITRLDDDYAEPVDNETTDITAYENFAYYKAIENAKFNCEFLKKSVTGDEDIDGNITGYRVGGTPSEHNIIYSEIFYKQAQLLRFPILSNTLLDPISMYVQTSMRLMPNVRGGLDPSTSGPVCAPMPFLADAQTLRDEQSWIEGLGGTEEQGNPGVYNVTGKRINLLGEDFSSLEWVYWGGQDSYSDFEYLKYQIEYPQMALNQRDEPLKSGNSVSTWTPSLSEDELGEIQGMLQALAGQEVMVIANDFSGIAKVTLTDDIDLTSDPSNPIFYGYLKGGAEPECFDTTFTPN